MNVFSVIHSELEKFIPGEFCPLITEQTVFSVIQSEKIIPEVYDQISTEMNVFSLIQSEKFIP